MSDMQSRMAYATTISHGSRAGLDNLDTTLYATVLDASALRPNPRQFSRCKDCAFPPPEQTEDKTTAPGKNSPWKYAK